MQDTYFSWLVEKIDNGQAGNYSKLLSFLYDKAFDYIIPDDMARFNDGINLRYIYEDEGHSIMDHAQGDCTILEMLVALCMRIEEQMCDPEVGDQCWRWFWIFIENLGLLSENNASFTLEYVSSVIDDFLNRAYDSDGYDTSIVRVDDPNKDCRSENLWMQVNWYLNEKF